MHRLPRQLLITINIIIMIISDILCLGIASRLAVGTMVPSVFAV